MDKKQKAKDKIMFNIKAAGCGDFHRMPPGPACFMQSFVSHDCMTGLHNLHSYVEEVAG